ncbi:MAG: hypothetical protein O3C51_07290 [Planctomycetota bacterium]|nr:hypothetical protein [Planctomycetota bacterium]
MTRQRIVLLYVVVLAVIVAGTLLALRSTGVARTFVVNALAGFLQRSSFDLDDAQLDLAEGRVLLRGLAIETDSSDDSGSGAARLDVAELDVAVDVNPLGEVGRVRAVRVRGLAADVDLAAGRFPDLGRILLPRADDTPATAAPPPPPSVEILESTLRLRLAPGAEPIAFTGVTLEFLPETEGSHRGALRGTMRGPNDQEVRVDGLADLASAEFRAVLRLVDVPLVPEMAEPYSRDAVAFLRSIGVGGTASSLSIWAEYPRRAPSSTGEVVRGELGAGVRLELEQLRCTVPQLPYPITDARAQLSADLGDGGHLAFSIEERSERGSIDVEGSVAQLFEDEPRLELSVEARDVLVDPVLGRALATLKDARNVWEAFEPSDGRGNASLRLTHAIGSGVRPRLSLDIGLEDVKARFVGFQNEAGERMHGFPHPLEALSGDVRLHDGRVSIEGVRGRLGQHEIRAEGLVIPKRGDTGGAVELDIESDELAFSPEIRAALAQLDPEFAAVYDDYSPAGTTTLRINVRTGGAIEDAGVRVQLRPLGASAAWRGFPCRVDQVTGLVDIGADGVVVQLEGTRDGEPVRVDGRFPRTAPVDGGPAALLHVTADRLQLDEEVRGAVTMLSQEIRDTIDTLGLDGAFAVDVTTWRDQGAETFGYDVRIDVEDGTLQLAELPLPTTGLRGPVFVHGEDGQNRVEVAAVRGVIDNGSDGEPASLTLHGTVDVAAAGLAMDLSAVVRGLELTPRLGKAVEAFGAFDFETWDLLDPSGQVDLVWRRVQEPTETTPHQTLRIQLLDVRSAADFLPAPAEHVYGDLLVVDGSTTFTDVRAQMAGATVHCVEGSVTQVEGALAFAALVSSPDFPVDDRLARLLDGPIAETWRARQIEGRVAVHELQMRLSFPDDGAPMRTELRGSLSARGLSLLLGTEVEDITGLWSIDAAEFGPDGGFARGRVEGGSATVFGHAVSDVQGTFLATPDHVEFGALRARLHGGTVTGMREDATLVHRFAGPGTLSFDLGWDGLSLDQVTRTANGRSDGMRGRLAGRFRLDSLVGGDIVDMKGSGEVRITEGDLGRVPVFTSIYSYLAEPRRPRFEGLAARFEVGDRQVRIPSFEVTSPLLSAGGKGSFDMDGYLDLRIDFPDFFGRSADWLLLPQAMRALTSELARFQVHGHLRDPQTRPLWLGRDPAKRAALGPIPASSARR